MCRHGDASTTSPSAPSAAASQPIAAVSSSPRRNSFAEASASLAVRRRLGRSSSHQHGSRRSTRISVRRCRWSARDRQAQPRTPVSLLYSATLANAVPHRACSSAYISHSQGARGRLLARSERLRRVRQYPHRVIAGHEAQADRRLLQPGRQRMPSKLRAVPWPATPLVAPGGGRSPSRIPGLRIHRLPHLIVCEEVGIDNEPRLAALVSRRRWAPSSTSMPWSASSSLPAATAQMVE